MKTFRGFSWSNGFMVRLTATLLIGFFSACLLYLLVNTLLFVLASVKLVSITVKLSLFLESWGFSTIFLFRSAKSLTELIAKAFLIGSVEWLAVALAGVFLFNGRPYLGVCMAFICLVGFGITQIWFVKSNPNCTAPMLEKESDRFSLVPKPPI